MRIHRVLKGICTLRKSKISLNNSAYIQILGDGTQGAKASVLVYSDGRSYLFNCPAGTQRFCFASKIKLDIEHIFLTNLNYDNISGFMGMVLTHQEMGTPSICVHSTKGITDIYEPLLDITVLNPSIKRDAKAYPPGIFQDSSIVIEPFVINNPQSHDTSQSETSKPIVAYGCTLPDVDGSLDPKKCRQLGVPVGPLLAKLKAGEDIQLPNGSIVKSSDVCCPKRPGSKFIIIDVPTRDHLNWLDKSSDMSALVEIVNDRNYELAIHLTPRHIVDSDHYKEILSRLSCKHMFASCSSTNRLQMIDQKRNMYLLNKIDEVIFPLPPFENGLDEIINEDLKVDRTNYNFEKPKILNFKPGIDLETIENNFQLRTLDRVNLKPRKSIMAPDIQLDLGATFRISSMLEGFDEALETLRLKQKSIPVASPYEPELTFLGTGSAIPGKYRNTSGILINFSHPKDFSVILDCGEDTYWQIYRTFGRTRTEEILNNLKLIYISHHHADHHVGLPQLLKKRSELTSDKALIFIPQQIEKSLNYYNQNIEDLSWSYESRITQKLSSKIFGSRPAIYNITDNFLEHIDLIGVDHCNSSFASVMKFKIGHPNMSHFTLCYSGDCRPSKEFAEAGKGCDLLIHEATFDDKGTIDAQLKKHCTTSEALDVSKNMKAKFTILTHFSQKFPKIPLFTEKFDDTIGVAFDHLKLKCPSDFPRLPILKPILEIVYYETIDQAKSRNDLDDLRRSRNSLNLDD